MCATACGTTYANFTVHGPLAIAHLSTPAGSTFGGRIASAFNPTDIFKDRAVLDFDTADSSVLREDRLGVFMIRGQYVFAAGSLTLDYSPRLARPTPLGGNVSAFSLREAVLNNQQRLFAKLNLKLGEDFTPELIVARTRGTWKIRKQPHPRRRQSHDSLSRGGRIRGAWDRRRCNRLRDTHRRF